uniref:Uncharacterized protein n=1 Tax=Anguilla anguilla TaxID=7936 RepID=A0A0E9WIG1_ANGAN
MCLIKKDKITLFGAQQIHWFKSINIYPVKLMKGLDQATLCLPPCGYAFIECVFFRLMCIASLYVQYMCVRVCLCVGMFIWLFQF